MNRSLKIVSLKTVSLKKILLFTLISTVVLIVFLATILTWLVKSESGSHWLLQQSFDLSPVAIEANGISGTLINELNIESLSINLPTAEIHATKITLSWHLTHLLSGVVDIKNVDIAELNIDLLATENNSVPDEPRNNVTNDSEKNSETNSVDGELLRNELLQNELFWLDFPVLINITSGKIKKLSIDDAQFEKLNLSGSIGHNGLEIKSLEAQLYGINLQANGKLAGPSTNAEPGQLEVSAQWKVPSENLYGSGTFSGNIKQLKFTQKINLPETVLFNGTIHNLFSKPELLGETNWASIAIPGHNDLSSNDGNIEVRSDFLSVQLKGQHFIKFEGWPEAPMQLDAFVDLQSIRIDSYSLAVLDGQVSGSGKFDYSDDLRGHLSINGTQINTGLIDENLPGHIKFDSSLKIHSLSELEIIIHTAKAQILDRSFTGDGRVFLSEGKLVEINTIINNGTNQLTADIKLGKQLTGSVQTKAPDLALLWPGLHGALETVVTLDGSPEYPQIFLTANAASVSYESHSLDTLIFSGKLHSDNGLAANLVTADLISTGLVVEEQKLGKLDFTLAGTLKNHQSTLRLAGDVVDAELRANGSWQVGQLTQSFVYGQIQPDGLASWQLNQNPTLQLSSGNGTLSAHCWQQKNRQQQVQQQKKTSICIDNSAWSPDSLHSKIVIDNFSLTTLKPLFPDNYNIDGTVDADFFLSRNKTKLQRELHWRQSHTLLTYADDIDEFQTVLDKIQIDLLSNETQTNLVANLTGEKGLSISATARVDGPLEPDSPLNAKAKGRLPSIELLRLLLQRVVNPGEIKGELTVDLDATGTLGEPLFTGGAKLNDGSLQLLGAGITVSDINITANSENSDKLQLTGHLRSGEGYAKIFGEAYTTDKGFLADIHIQGENLASVRVPNLSLDSSPDLRLRISKDLFDISGTIKIPRAEARIRDLPKNTVSRSADVIVHAPDRIIDHDTKKQKTVIVTGEVNVLLGDQVKFNGFGLNSRLDGELKLMQTRGGFLRSAGTVRVRDGFLTGYGKELRVDHGELTFTENIDDPLINIQVSRNSNYEGREYTIGLRLTGSAQQVKTEPFSRPSMSDNDVLSFLLLDRPTNSGDNASGATLALGLQQLSPLEGGRLGLDEVNFETNDANEATMVAGKRINNKLFVRYVFGTSGQAGSFKIRFRLGRGFSLEASTGAAESMDLIYLLER